MNLRNKLAFFIALNSYVELITRGTSPLSLPDAVANSLSYVKAFGGTSQASTPTPDTPMDIVSNNGVLKVSRNLFDPTKVLFGYYRDRTTGDKTQNSSNFMSSDDGYIPCLPNTTYTFVGKNKTNGTYSKYNTIYFFDSAKNYLDASPYELSQPTTGTTPSNCHYLQVRSNPLDNSTPIQDAFAQFNWQLEQASTATPYRPYGEIYTDGTVETIKDSLNNTATAEMLLKVGDYQDVQSILDGAITRNVGVKVLDGTEAWAPILYTLPNAYRISWAGATATLGTIRYSGLFCTHFEDGGSVSTAAPNKMFFANDLNINFPMTSDFDTIGKCLQWLADQYAAGTPVIVVYPLATPTTESVAGQTLQVQAGNNTLQITQASMTGLELEAKYKKRK